MAAITITSQPADVDAVFDEIDETMAVVASAGEETISYAWYIAEEQDLSDAAAISGQTTDTLTIPTDTAVGTYYIFCRMTAATYDQTDTDAAVLTVDENDIVISAQPEETTVTYDDISETMDITADAGTQTLIYAWYLGQLADGSDAEVISGQTTNELTIPTDLEGGTYYVYCSLSATGYNSLDSDIVPLIVAGEIPALTGAITGAYVHECLANADTSVRDRFDEACARSGITIPDTSAALRTAQIELFMSIL